MKEYKKITNEIYDIVMILNDPELGLDWMALKPKLLKYFKKLQPIYDQT
jgi:hypothetical protein